MKSQPTVGVERRPASVVRDLLRNARTRAYRRLERAFEFPIAMLAAPAGYGKSTVVRDFLESEDRAYRLVRIVRGNADTLGFLRALASSVADVAPEFASTFVTVYARIGDAPDACEQLAAWVAGYLSSLRALMVVDALEAVNDVGLTALISALIDRTRGQLGWIVIAENSTGFPIARWLAEYRMDLPVDTLDLTFREDDLSALNGAGNPSPLHRRYEEVCTLVGGFPATLALALASRCAIDLDTLPHAPSAMYAFFAEAELSRQGCRVRDFIEQTCLFAHFDAALLECAGFVEVDDILLRLGSEAGILAPDSAGSYTYDRCLRDFVCAQLSARANGAFDLVAARSAAAYELDGSYAAAIDMATLRSAQNAVCALLTTHGYALIDRGEFNAVRRGLASVPHDVLLAYPGALAVKASLESLHGNFDIAEAWFRVALDRITDPVQRNDIVYRFAIDLVRRERPEAIEILRPVVASIDDDAVLAAPLMAQLAAAYATNRQLVEASLLMDRALRLFPRVKDRAVRAKILFQAGFVALHLRDIRAAKSFAAQAYEDATQSYTYDVAARALSVLYNIAIDFEDDVVASRAYIEKLADASLRAGSSQLLLYATLCQYEIEVLAGNVVEIEALNARLTSLEVFYSILTTETLLPAQALQATWNGDFYRAFQLLASSAEHQVSPDRRAFRHAEIAVYAAAAGLRHEASAAAESALTTLREVDALDVRVLTTRAYIALTFVLLRRHGRAGKLLRDLSSRGAMNPRVAALARVVRALAERWTAAAAKSDLAALLETLDALDMGGLVRMIEALPLPENARCRAAQLTTAERQMLGRLAAGSIANDVAGAFTRASSTQTADIASICRKLGCYGWRHAIAIARREGLLSDVVPSTR